MAREEMVSAPSQILTTIAAERRMLAWRADLALRCLRAYTDTGFHRMSVRSNGIALFLLVAISSCIGQVVPTAVPSGVPENPRYVFQSLDEHFGVGTVTVTSLAQDGRGFLWMGTQQGLLRYDGGTIVKFTRAEGLPTDVIDQLVAGPDGNLWVGTDDGVAVYNGRRFQKIAIPLAGARMDSLYQIVAVDAENHALIATSAGLVRLDPKAPSHYELWNRARGLPEDEVKAIFCGDGRNAYFITGKRVGVLNVDDGHVDLLPGNFESDTSTPIAVFRDRDGLVWVRTSNHVFREDPGGTQFLEDDDGIPKANDFGIPALDRSGQLMIPTVRGLFRRANHAWQQIGEHQGMETDATFAALEDREGAFWVGFGGLGVGRWPGSNSWLGWTKAEGLPDNVVWCEVRDQQGRLWVGTDNGLAMWDQDAHRWRVFTDRDGLGGDTVRQLLVGSDGAIWALSIPGGLTRIDAASLRLQKLAAPPAAAEPTGMAIAPNGDVWVGTFKYLKVLTNVSPATYKDVPVPAAASGMTTHPKFAPDGSLWTSGRAGAARFDGKQWATFTMAQGLRANVVPAVLPLSASEAWIRYVEPFGLGHLRITSAGRTTVEHLTTHEGLRTDSVFLLGQDRSGRIWAGGNGGVTVLDSTHGAQSFTRGDGLLWDDLSGGTIWADPDGSIYFGTSRGLARYQPAPDDFQAYRPDVFLTSVKLGGEERLGEPNPVTPYKRRLFEVQFSELTFRDPATVRCRYRMDPVENDFVETTQHEARYTSLPAGNYDFDLACRYSDGSWSAPVTFNFRIAPAWWETWWAKLMEALAAIALLVLTVWLRTRALEKDRQRLEEAVALRSAELAKANKELAEAALTDPLTGARNRRFFESTIDVLLQQVLREYHDPKVLNKRDLIFYLVDIDHFKQVNDNFGHPAGDAVLKQVVDRLNRAVRASDILVRWGGEEFLIVATSTQRSDAEVLALRMLQSVGSEPLALDGGKSLPRTVSIGWAAYPWCAGNPKEHSLSAILDLVDGALYIAKNSGRNRSVGAISLDEAAGNAGCQNLAIGNVEVLVRQASGPLQTGVTALGE
jgi:diguanylate cyclase (GGDEF)-like protein